MAKTLLPGQTPLKSVKQELFCVLYAGVSSKSYFGNATQCYLHAYGGEEKIYEIDENIELTFEKGSKGDIERRKLKGEKKRLEHVSNTAGTRLLSNVGVAKRVAYLLDRYLSDDYADREMAFVIGQRDDLMSKVAAYREVAKVKERVRGAGAISGDFSFTWDDDATDTKKKKPVLKSVRVKTAPADDAAMIASFEE